MEKKIIDGATLTNIYIYIYIYTYIYIYNRMRYLVNQESAIRYVNSHSYGRIKIDSNDSLPLEKNVYFE